MRVPSAVPGLVAACLVLPICSASAGAVLTPLNPPGCKSAPGNAAATREDHSEVIYYCAGVNGWRIRKTAFGTYVHAVFTPPSANKPALTLSAPYDIGPRIEWHMSGQGTPFAAVVRLHTRLESGKTASALAVLALSSRSACVAAIVDGAAADANGQAHKAASGLANGAACPSIPTIIGPQTEVARELSDRNKVN